MKYQNWRSYLSKSLFILFLGISILLVKLFSKSILKHELDDLYINYLLDGMIFLYGIVLILIYLIINKKYIYLLNYGLLYAIIGCCLMFVSPTFESYLDSANIHFTVINKFEDSFHETYFEMILILEIIIHGIFKLIVSDTYSKMVRILEIFAGIMFITLGFVFIYGNLNTFNININIGFINYIRDYAFYFLMLLLLIDIFLFVLRIVKNRSFIKEEIEEQILESKASFRNSDDNFDNQKNRKRKHNDNVEVIDLERFFKTDKAN